MSHFVARWLKISLVVIVGCGFLAMMIYALVNRDEIRSSQIEPPLIMPQTEPLKRRPDQPGGMQIPNRDKLVFDLLDSSNTTLGETGVSGAKANVSATLDVAGANPTMVSDSVAAVEAVGMAVEEVSSAKIVEAAVPVKIAVTPTAVAPVAVPVVKPAEVKVAKVEEKKAEPKIEAQVDVKKPEAKVAEKPVAGGKWGVQLAAVNSTADGNAMTAKASKDFAALKGLSPRVSAAPGGKKYRVQFVGLKDRDAAAAVCAKLAGKQACFPVSVQ